MIRDRKSKDGTRRFYTYVVGADGKRRYVGAFGTRKEALAAEQDGASTQRKIATGELPPEIDDKRALREAAKEWLASLKARGSRSHDGYEDRMKSCVLPRLGDIPIARMTKAQVMAWRDELATRRAPATVNGCLTALSSAFSYFVDRQWVERNPCHGVERVERPDRLYTWVETREEITKLLAQCPGDVLDIVALALGTGMRLDELLHLQWADVDIDRRLISVHRGRQGTVKSGKARRVPILDAILPMLRARGLRRDGEDLVFPGERSKAVGGKTKVRSKAGARDAFKLAVKRAGLDVALRFHDLRHTFASHWVMNGGDIFRLSKVLGHSSVVITQRTYAHLAPEVWAQDYLRVVFTVPAEARVYEFKPGVGRTLAAVPLAAVVGEQR